MGKSNPWIDIIGWIGAVALLLAYGFVSTRKLQGDSGVYQILNFIGAAFLMANSFFYGAFPSAAVNIVWISIAVFAVLRKKFRAQKG